MGRQEERLRGVQAQAARPQGIPGPGEGALHGDEAGRSDYKVPKNTTMTDEAPIKYPNGLSDAANESKRIAGEAYDEAKKQMEQSRVEYKLAYEAMHRMGLCHEKVVGCLEIAAGALEAMRVAMIQPNFDRHGKA